MSFEWSDFLDLAVKLTKSPDEASRRSAVSRAYYAVFCAARDWVESYYGVDAHREAKEQNTGVHKYVWGVLGTVKQGSHADLSDTGKRIMRSRVKCDYRDKVEKLDLLSATEVTRASKLLEDLGAIDET